jgi:hypothetical protein
MMRVVRMRNSARRNAQYLAPQSCVEALVLDALKRGEAHELEDSKHFEIRLRGRRGPITALIEEIDNAVYEIFVVRTSQEDQEK